MSLRPVYDEIVLEHGSHAVILRPSLRAASALERSHDGFDRLFRRIAEFHTGTVREIILIAATDRKDAAAFLDSVFQLPLGRIVQTMQQSLVRLCLGFFPTPEANAKAVSSDKPMRWRDLYIYAAGWLHWSPETAWSATPAEIIDAMSGHFDMLRAIHGSADDDQDPSAEQANPNLNSKLDRAGLDKLRGKGRLS